MNTAEYYKMKEMERRLWWFRGRRRLVLGALQAGLRRSSFAGAPLRLGDVGCGTGSLVRELHDMGRTIGFDLSSTALSLCGESNDEAQFVRGDAMRLPLREASFHALTALDIIEHLPHDSDGVAELYRALVPGGFAVFTVPAHPKLWGAHDVALHHQRRYTHHSFRELLTNAGFAIEHYSYAMSVAYPVARLWRKLRSPAPQPSTTSTAKTDDFMPPTLINGALYALLCGEAWWLNTCGGTLPFGLSLIATVRK